MTNDAQLATWLSARFPLEVETPRGSDAWDSFAQAACRAGLAGIVLDVARGHGVDLPQRVVDTLRDRAGLVAANNLGLMKELARLLGQFNRAGLPVMLLKGAALNLTIYNQPGLRPMSDLDLMVHPQDTQRACDLLEQCGFRRGFDLVRPDFFPRYYYELEFVTHSPRPVRIDLHVRPFRPLRTARTMPDDALWHDAQRVQCGHAEAVIPAPNSMFIHLAAHAAFHGCSRLLWLYDLKRLVKANTRALEWSEIATRAQRWRLSLPVAQATHRATELLGSIGLPSLLKELSTHKTTWRDRWTLAQAPRDAISPIRHVLVNGVCTPDLRFALGYIFAHLMPSTSHLAEVYPYRHAGWTFVARILRLTRASVRAVARPFRTLATRIASRKPPLRATGVSEP